ncbi:MAG: DUF4159 domain-containing protein, partial [Hyphomicrobiales bacterium]|nr:DUF4159 domain-containing protein [Hyphomicrobiales bacterium]
MFGLPLAFTAPLVLGALLALPVLYYLLRLTPPRPREVAFPPLKLILDLKPKEETPARTPWWLLLLRLLLAALIIMAMAGPIWNPPPQGEGGRGPLLVLLDDGWPSAVQWDQRKLSAQQAVIAAARQGRPSALAAMSEGGREIAMADPQATTERLRALQPVPYSPDRTAALTPVKAFLSANRNVQVLWIASGLELGNARKFAEGLRAAGGAGLSVRILLADRSPLAVVSADNAPGALEVLVRRAGSDAPVSGVLKAYDLKGLSVGEAPFSFGSGNETKGRFELPIELRNEIARIEIQNEKTAGAVTLLDARFKRRRVAIISGETADTAQPLLAPTYYLTKALAPFADVREPRAPNRDPIDVALEEKPSVIILADVGTIPRQLDDKLKSFIDNGGVLLRFAGTRLAAASTDLVPVRLRRGGRVLGGALSWDQPRKLARFERGSPFYGLPAPPEVTVLRQVLAEPDAGLPGKTWAALDDGTPLITADRRGKGLVVLVHVTADTTWSNLPLSGLYVEILRRVIAMAGDVAEGDATGTDNTKTEAKARVSETLAPSSTLDGFGMLGSPPVTAKPVAVNYKGQPGRDHPPGFYGPPEALLAINTLRPDDRLVKADLSGLNMDTIALNPSEPVDLRPWIIALAFLLFLGDALASIWLAGGLRRRSGQHGSGQHGSGSRGLKAGAATAAIVLGAAFLLTLPAPPAQAQTPPAAATIKKASPGRVLSAQDLKSALQTRLAYVVTGNSEVDRTSQLGLLRVSQALAARTALEPGAPMGVNPAKDELSFYPLLYWPIVPDRPQPPQAAVTRIKAFMKQGGTIIFDTRDAQRNRPGGSPTPETAWLRVLLAGVDVPELEPLPRDHVLTKTFYLIDKVTGRNSIGRTWIEALPAPGKNQTGRPARAGDSVSPIVITSNDLAGAWAYDRSGAPLYPMESGGERAREFALRSGINLVMYTLTGNYKADQV